MGDGPTPPVSAATQKEGQKHETKGNIQEKAGNLLYNDKLKAKGATACPPRTPQSRTSRSQSLERLPASLDVNGSGPSSLIRILPIPRTSSFQEFSSHDQHAMQALQTKWKDVPSTRERTPRARLLGALLSRCKVSSADDPSASAHPLSSRRLPNFSVLQLSMQFFDAVPRIA